MREVTPSKMRYDLLTVIALLCVLGPFLLTLINAIVNIPNADDFDVFLDWANHHSVSRSISQQMQLLIAKHNEHLVLANRLIALGSLQLNGEISFQAILLFVAILYCLSFSLLAFQHSKLQVITLALIFFQPQLGEVHTWATAGASIVPMVFFSICAIRTSLRAHFLAQSLAVVCAIAATSCFAGGIAVFPAIMLLQLVARRYRQAVLWLLCSVLVVVSLHFHNSTKSVSAFTSLEEVNQLLQFYLALLGSFLGFSHRYLAQIVGIICTLFWLYTGLTCLRNRETKHTLLAHALLSFASIACFAVAFGRYSGGIENAYLTSRYKVFSMLAIAAISVLSLQKVSQFQNVRLRISATLGIVLSALLVCIASYGQFLSEVRWRAPLLRDSAIRWQLSKSGLMHPVPQRAAQILSRSAERTIYTIPETITGPRIARSVETLVDEKSKPLTLFSAVEHLIQKPPYLFIDGYAFTSNTPENDSQIRIELRSETASHFFTAEQRIRRDVWDHFRKHGQRYSLEGSGFSTLINCTSLLPGTYVVRVWLENQGQWHSRGLTRIPKLECEDSSRVETQNQRSVNTETE